MSQLFSTAAPQGKPPLALTMTTFSQYQRIFDDSYVEASRQRVTRKGSTPSSYFLKASTHITTAEKEYLVFERPEESANSKECRTSTLLLHIRSSSHMGGVHSLHSTPTTARESHGR